MLPAFVAVPVKRIFPPEEATVELFCRRVPKVPEPVALPVKARCPDPVELIVPEISTPLSLLLAPVFEPVTSRLPFTTPNVPCR